jgi:hypothetical protein
MESGGPSRNVFPVALCAAAAATLLVLLMASLRVPAGGPLAASVPPAAAGQASDSAPTSVAVVTQDASPLVGCVTSMPEVTKTWSRGFFANDLRSPRPPRQRSERPSTGADGIEALLNSSAIKLMLRIDLHRAFLADTVADRPLSGHYSSLLRPPSAGC